MTGLERLRDLVDGMAKWSVCSIMEQEWCKRNGISVLNNRSVDDVLLEIANQIERETAHDPSKDVSMSAYDLLPEEDRKAIAWVREYGGVEECDRKVEASMEVGDKYTLLRMELGKLLGYDLMGQLDAADEELVEKIGKRVMPEGMEWPRFGDGEPVRVMDEFEDSDGKRQIARSIQFTGDTVILRFDDGISTETYYNGCRVKRPAPKVLDSEGVECNVGDDVWWVLNKTGDFRIIRIEANGKCAIRDDDADEPCGMTVPSTELTHKRPVLDADGVEIRVGETVWDVQGNGPYEVEGINSDGTVRIKGNDYDYFGDDFTHERPDSWERLEEDCGMFASEYAEKFGLLKEMSGWGVPMRRDLVRRAKKLAGVEL